MATSATPRPIHMPARAPLRAGIVAVIGASGVRGASCIVAGCAALPREPEPDPAPTPTPAVAEPTPPPAAAQVDDDPLGTRPESVSRLRRLRSPRSSAAV